jgi:hypothetical protein
MIGGMCYILVMGIVAYRLLIRPVTEQRNEECWRKSLLRLERSIQ